MTTTEVHAPGVSLHSGNHGAQSVPSELRRRATNNASDHVAGNGPIDFHPSAVTKASFSSSSSLSSSSDGMTVMPGNVGGPSSEKASRAINCGGTDTVTLQSFRAPPPTTANERLRVSAAAVAQPTLLSDLMCPPRSITAHSPATEGRYVALSEPRATVELTIAHRTPLLLPLMPSAIS